MKKLTPNFYYAHALMPNVRALNPFLTDVACHIKLCLTAIITHSSSPSFCQLYDCKDMAVPSIGGPYGPLLMNKDLAQLADSVYVYIYI